MNTSRLALLVQLIQRAHQDGEPVGQLLSTALGQVARDLPRGAESLVEQDPDGWQADHIRALVGGEIGWPDRDPLNQRADLRVVNDQENDQGFTSDADQ